MPYELNRPDDADGGASIQKIILTPEELKDVQKKIEQMTKRGVISSKIEIYLQGYNEKFREEWAAEAIYDTETKRLETNDIKKTSASAGLEKFKIIMGPNACDVCRKFTDNGNRVFQLNDLRIDGYEVPPIHQSCYCVLIPTG